MQIRRVELASGDSGAQARFWRNSLGLPVDEVDGRTEVRFRRSTVSFLPGGGEARYHFALNIPRGRIRDALAWLDERAEVLPFADGRRTIRFDWSRSDAVYFTDAGGNVVELMARDVLPYDDDRPFAPEHLLEVTEIGLASRDVEATVAAVRDVLGAEVYWGGKGKLTAVGDAVGAVLVTPEGRGWIPTGLPAAPAPTRVVADGRRDATADVPGGPYVIESIGPAAGS